MVQMFSVAKTPIIFSTRFPVVPAPWRLCDHAFGVANCISPFRRFVSRHPKLRDYHLTKGCGYIRGVLWMNPWFEKPG
jgi:hypothetical protein